MVVQCECDLWPQTLWYIWTVSGLVIIRCRGKFPLEEKNVNRAFQVQFLSFYPASFSYYKSWEIHVFASLPPSFFQVSLLPAPPALPGSSCCTWDALGADWFPATSRKKLLDRDQKRANGKEAIRYVLQTICFQPFLSPVASCNQFLIIHMNRDLKWLV